MSSFQFLNAVVNCGRIGVPENGEITLSETTFGSVAVYACDEGFDLVGELFRTCQANAEWTGEEPVCERKTANNTYSTVLFLHSP